MENKRLSRWLKIATIPILAVGFNNCNQETKLPLPPVEELIFITKDFDGSTLLFRKFLNGDNTFYRDKDNDGYIDSFGDYPNYSKHSMFNTEIKEYEFPNLGGKVKILDLKKRFEKGYFNLEKYLSSKK